MSRAQRGISRNTTARGSNANMFLTIVNSDCKSCQKRGKERETKEEKTQTERVRTQNMKLLSISNC